jgi:stage II sporulation protein D
MKKKRKRKADVVTTRLLCILLLLLICVMGVQRIRLQQLMEGVMTHSAYEDDAQEDEVKIALIVAKEISITAAPEAVRAQCVIARTNLYEAREQKTTEPTGFTMEELQELWGDEFEHYYELLEDYVASTGGQALACGESYIYAAYHAVSAGETRNFTECYPEAGQTCLTKVSCHADTGAEEYLSVQEWSREEFNRLCMECLGKSGETEIIKRDTSGYVLTLAIDGEQVTGEVFRNALNLPSSCMSITIDDEKVRIVTKGKGHGFGLSQYTAQQMALEGSSYEEILAYFYPGSELVTYKP